MTLMMSTSVTDIWSQINLTAHKPTTPTTLSSRTKTHIIRSLLLFTQPVLLIFQTILRYEAHIPSKVSGDHEILQSYSLGTNTSLPRYTVLS